jgi:HK97 family phage major capsid protein
VKLEDIVARQEAVAEELKPLTIAAELDEAQRARYEELATEYDSLDAQRADIESFEERRSADKARIERLKPVPSGREGADFDRDPLGDPDDVQRISAIGKNPWDIAEVSRSYSPDDLMARALDAVEQTPGSNDARREALTRMLEADGDEQMYRLVLATTSPAYKAAYGKLARSGGSFASFTPAESEALAFADSVMRAMSIGTNSAGGYLVPTDIEAAVTLSADGTNNPLYNEARRVQTTGQTYRVVSSGNAAWSWDGENTEVSDDTTTFANTDIPLYVAQGFVPYSYASANSLSNVSSIVSDVLMGGWNDLVGAALTTGSGSSQPTGIITALVASSPTVLVASATTDTYAVADVYNTFNPLPARHRRNAKWMSSVEAMTDTRRFGTAVAHTFSGGLDGDPTSTRILGRPWVENEDMDPSVTALANNYYLLFGDLKQFVIAEGLGTITRFIPDVVGTTGRPIGASGVFMMAHFGSDSVLDGAFRLLNVT